MASAAGRRIWMIAVPLAAPGIVAAAVFAFIAVWTEFFFALILTSRHAFTLPTVFRAFLGFQGAQYGEACALADRPRWCPRSSWACWSSATSCAG